MVFDDEFDHDVPVVLVQSWTRAYDFLNCVNITQDAKIEIMYIPIMIDYINLYL